MEILRFQENSVSELIDIFEHEEFIDVVEEKRIDNGLENDCENKGTEDIKEAETEKIYADEKIETLEEMKQIDLVDEINVQDYISNEENTSLEQEQSTEDIKETGLENEVQELVHQNIEVEKVEETAKKHAGLIKKPKAVVKKTIAQPFSSKTDKKVVVKEKPSSSLQNSKLSKLPSFNTKVDTQNANGAKKIPELKRVMSNTSRSSVARNSTSSIEKAQAKDIHSKNTLAKAKEGEEIQPDKVKKSNTFKASPLPSFYLRKDPATKPEPKKDGEEAAKLDKLKKSNTFKASPLPRFYHRKDPPSVVAESKKATTTRSNSSELVQQNNLFAEGIKIDKEDRNNKAASRTISTTAKETIHKLLEGAWEDPSTQKTKVPKNSSSVPSGRRAELEIVQ